MDWIGRVKRAKRESKYIEFKSEFDPTSSENWCEILKDVVAISNSGGGLIGFGLDSHGCPTGSDVSSLLALDPSVISDKIHQYTGVHFSGFEMHDLEKGNVRIAALQIEASNVPMVFIRPGTYQIQGAVSRKRHFHRARYTSAMVQKVNLVILKTSDR